MIIPALSLTQAEPDFRAAFCDSLKQTGFARIVDHGIDTQRLQSAYQSLKELFDLPLTCKQRYELANLGQRGYTGFGKEKAKGQTLGDLKEFWHIGKELPANSVYRHVYPKNRWPAELPYFKGEFLRLYADLEEIALFLLAHISTHFKIENAYFPSLVNEGNSVLRLIHYPPVKGLNTQNQMRAAPHADINLMTLLVGATDSGLELLDKHGKWQAVHTGPNEIIVDTGDMMALITGNTLPSTVHRVINPDSYTTGNDNKPRYSMPFFLHPHSNAVLECLPQFENSQPCKAISAGDFLEQRLRENGLMS